MLQTGVTLGVFLREHKGVFTQDGLLFLKGEGVFAMWLLSGNWGVYTHKECWIKLLGLEWNTINDCILILTMPC